MHQAQSGPAAGPFHPAPEAAFDPAASTQAALDAEHLRLLRIGYFIAAGQAAVLIPFGLLYAGMGLMMGKGPMASAGAAGGGSPAAMVPWFFGAFGAFIAFLAILATAARILTAVRLKERRWRVFCMVTAGFLCFEAPYGTAVGIMTLMVLGRPSVRAMFQD